MNRTRRRDDRLDAAGAVISQPLNQAEDAGGQHRDQEAEGDCAGAAAGRPRLPVKIERASAPAIAISDPTDRSMPPVAMTSVMPTPDDHDGADLGEIDVQRSGQVAKFGVIGEIERGSGGPARPGRRSAASSAGTSSAPRCAPVGPVAASLMACALPAPCAMAAMTAGLD